METTLASPSETATVAIDHHGQQQHQSNIEEEKTFAFDDEIEYQ